MKPGNLCFNKVPNPTVNDRQMRPNFLYSTPPDGGVSFFIRNLFTHSVYCKLYHNEKHERWIRQWQDICLLLNP